MTTKSLNGVKDGTTLILPNDFSLGKPLAHSKAESLIKLVMSQLNKQTDKGNSND